MTRPFYIGPWTIEPSLHRFARQGEEARMVSHKVMTALVCLAERKGGVVSKEELIDRVWDGAFTSDESLTTVIYELRKALDDSARQPRYIETIRKGGYRLLAEVVVVAEQDDDRLESTAVAVDAAASRVPSSETMPSPEETRPPDAKQPKLGLKMLALVATVGLLAVAAASLPFSRQTLPATTKLSAPLTPQSSAEAMVNATANEPRLESLAVLPLTSFGETCGEDAFANGLTEMLVVDLAEEIPLEVLPSIATRSHGERWDLDQVASELDADLVIEGSVIRSGGRLWLSVQLVDTASGRMLWGGSFERQMEDPLLVQRDLASSIASEVQRIVVEAASTAAAGDGMAPRGPILSNPATLAENPAKSL